MSSILFDIDTQEDFIDAEGRLQVPVTQSVRDAMDAVMEWVLHQRVPHVASADDHEYNDAEIVYLGKPNFSTTFPPHCMRGTSGAEKIVETLQADPVPFGLHPFSMEEIATLIDGRDEVLLHKKNFDVFTNPNTEKVLQFFDPTYVYVMGVATDICVNAAVNGLLRWGARVIVIEDAIAGLDPDNTASCLRSWQARGVTFITSDKLAGISV